MDPAALIGGGINMGALFAASKGLVELPVNPHDLSMAPQPAAAGVSALKMSKVLVTNCKNNLENLERQAWKAFKISNQAESSRMNIERFLTGSNCKTAALDANCLLAILSPQCKRLNFI